MSKVKMRVKAVRVLDESNEASDSDEPYVIVFVADITNRNQPHGKTTAYAWSDADEGELLTTLMKDEVPPNSFFQGADYCWGPNGKATDIPNADNLIVLAGVMENDDGDVGAGRSMVNSIMGGAMANIAGSDLTRDEIAARLRQDMGGALSQARMSGGPNFDDRVGSVKEVRFRQSDVTKAKTGRVVKNVTFNGGDSEGAYRVAVELKRD